jgi:hypothetical protein
MGDLLKRAQALAAAANAAADAACLAAEEAKLENMKTEVATQTQSPPPQTLKTTPSSTLKTERKPLTNDIISPRKQTEKNGCPSTEMPTPSDPLPSEMTHAASTRLDDVMETMSLLNRVAESKIFSPASDENPKPSARGENSVRLSDTDIKMSPRPDSKQSSRTGIDVKTSPRPDSKQSSRIDTDTKMAPRPDSKESSRAESDIKMSPRPDSKQSSRAENDIKMSPRPDSKQSSRAENDIKMSPGAEPTGDAASGVDDRVKLNPRGSHTGRETESVEAEAKLPTPRVDHASIPAPSSSSVPRSTEAPLPADVATPAPLPPVEPPSILDTMLHDHLDKRSKMVDRQKGPAQVVCYICCAEFGTSSLAIHQKTCLKKQ